MTKGYDLAYRLRNIQTLAKAALSQLKHDDYSGFVPENLAAVVDELEREIELLGETLEE